VELIMTIRTELHLSRRFMRVFVRSEAPDRRRRSRRPPESGAGAEGPRTTRLELVGHHDSAATHHVEAAAYHRAASSHYRAGSAPDLAALQALVAYGHTLCALNRGGKANAYYTGRKLIRHPGARNGWHCRVGATMDHLASAKEMQDEADHHTTAATHHEMAALHHDAASRLCIRNEYRLAAEEFRIAFDHARNASAHGKAAARCHVAKHGRGGPIAEIR
jgi:hypothetical protein